MSSRIIVCDIEGTTTSISFVKDKLFPYAAKNAESFLTTKWDEEDTKEAVKMLRDQSATDKQDNVDGCVEIAAETEEKAKQIESIVANVKWQMEHDRKAGPLKNLQGLMWVEAYKAGSFKGQVYEDVAPAFEAWTKADRKIFIYSSGSASIQKVHFEHSDAGDLAKYLSGYFDTKVGAKQEKSSYEAILKEIGQANEVNAKDVLFLTDVPGEAKAAKEAGLEVMLVKRPGNAELTEADLKAYKVVETFADILPAAAAAETKTEAEEPPQKRKLEEDATSPPAKLAKMDESVAEEQIAAIPTPPPQSESKTEDETKDVPMAAVEEQKEVEEKQKQKEQPPTAEKTEDEAKSQDKETEKAQQDDTMEVDSTTAPTVPVSSSTKDDSEKTAAEKKSPMEVAEDTKKRPTVTEEEKKTPDCEPPTTAAEMKDGKETDKEATPKQSVTEEAKVETTAKEMEEEKATDAEQKKPTEEEPAKENGSTVVDAEATEVPAARELENGKGTANGHDDSDKENDKSMEASAEEVSTTSAPTETADATDEALIAAKKASPAADPVPAEVDAES